MAVRPSFASPIQIARQIAAKTSASPWIWMMITCTILGISGGLRFWRDRQFQTLAAESASCPFPLNELPKSLGNWRATDEADHQLDPQVARVAGSTEHILRSYVDEKTGDRVSVLVLYGLATRASSHTPEVCYPAAGYQPVTPAIDHEVSIPDSTVPVHFRSATFAKRVGGIGRYEEVYYTFLHHGEWLPDTSSRWKSFRYYPGIFKIQIQRPVSALSQDSPSEFLLTEFVREINSRLAQHKPRTANGVASSPAAPTPAATVHREGRPD